jgi:hypothetical protein
MMSGPVDCTICACATDAPASWRISGNDNRHPVITPNMFRVSGGRIVQIGMSWLGHGESASQQTLCSSEFGFACVRASGADWLGPGCSDPNSASSNGAQFNLTPRTEVDPVTGAFPYPSQLVSAYSGVLQRRLRVNMDDMDPAMHPSAVFFVEAQYVSQDDAQAGNDNNNSSYRRVTVNPASSPTPYAMTMQGQTRRRVPAIYAWREVDPAVQVTMVNVPGDGRIIVASRAHAEPGGMWRYEYAVQNLNSWRSVSALSVPIGPGTAQHAGFRAPAYHSGEVVDATPWTFSTGGESATWRVVGTAQSNPTANAIRWGTLYSFTMLSPMPPSEAVAELLLFRGGWQNTVSAPVVAPQWPQSTCPCDFNRVGGLTIQDLFDFYTAFFQGNADYNNDGATNTMDLMQFSDCFQQGCP